MTRPRIAALILLLSFACSTGRAAPAPELRDGDVIFQTSRSAQSRAVQRATGSPYSHMGMVIHRHGKPFVLEAAATVRFTPLAAWIARGSGGRFVVKRLRDAATRLTPEALERARHQIAALQGKPYDPTFEWSDDRIYCSELVWKIYDRALGVQIGALAKLRDFDLDDPAVREKLRERYGESVPLAEPVISPAAMFASPDLVLVIDHASER
jgi:hypothetical protein